MRCWNPLLNYCHIHLKVTIKHAHWEKPTVPLSNVNEHTIPPNTDKSTTTAESMLISLALSRLAVTSCFRLLFFSFLRDAFSDCWPVYLDLVYFQNKKKQKTSILSHQCHAFKQDHKLPASPTSAAQPDFCYGQLTIDLLVLSLCLNAQHCVTTLCEFFNYGGISLVWQLGLSGAVLHS